MAEFLCWNPYWVLCAVNTIMFSCLEYPAGCRVSVAAGGWAAAPNSSSCLKFYLYIGLSSSLWLSGEWLLSGCEAIGGMTNKMLLLQAWLLSLKSSQPSRASLLYPYASPLLSQLNLSSLYSPNQTLLPNARWKSCLLSSPCSPCTAGVEI